MAKLKDSRKEKIVHTTTSGPEHTALDAFEVLITFFFTLNEEKISRLKLEKIWLPFLSLLRKHSIQIPGIQNGTQSLDYAISFMMESGLLATHLNNERQEYLIVLTDKKVKMLQESVNQDLKNAVLIVAPRIFSLYREL